MKYPKFLSNNSTIGIPAPSSGAYNEKKANKMKHSELFWNQLGYSLVTSNHLYHSKRGRSASKKERAKEINEMFKNEKIDLVLCATGGDFLIEILPFIDFKILEEHPKLVAGFSDPTGLLYPITTKYDIATIYGSNFSSFGAENLYQSHQDFLDIITGNLHELHSYDRYEEEGYQETTGLEGYNLTEKVEWKSLKQEPIEIEGRIIGGCLDIISELSGTKYDGIQEFNEKYKKDGIIWYFDNCELSMEETIRVLWKLKELNYFQYTKGIIFGRFGKETSSYNYDTKSCLEDSVLKELDIPIIYDADISHKPPCLPIINGSIAKVSYRNGKGKISYRLVE